MMINLKNKRGQGLSTQAIILIVLGIAVLVVLIIGFTIGWGNIAPWLSGDNVDTIANQCQAACSTMGVYDFCTKPRELKASDLPFDEEGKAQKKVMDTCLFFSTYENKHGNTYGIEPCPGLCPPVESEEETSE
jgi:hypothetical protein